MDFVMCAIWALVLIVVAIVHFQTNNGSVIWTGLAAVAALVLAFVGQTFLIQFAVFLGISLSRLLLSVFLIQRNAKKDKTNITALIGQRCLVVEEISNIHSQGAVSLKGLVWSARSFNEHEIIEEGTVVVVHKIDGVKLICKREK